MKVYILFTTVLIILSFLSCNDKKKMKVNNLSNEKYDSVKYYKDVDWITFEGLGLEHGKPFTKYPYTEFQYKRDTIDIIVHYTESKASKVQLHNFINGNKYYSSHEYGDGQYTTFYWVFDKANSKKLCFWCNGKIDSSFNGDIREVEYYSKEGDNYKVEIYNGHFNSVIIPWRKIINKDSAFLEKEFCYYTMYIEEFRLKTFSTIFEQTISYCNTYDMNKIDTNRKVISDKIEAASIFYFKAQGGNGFLPQLVFPSH